MSARFPEVRVGEPIRFETLTVFPLFSTTPSEVAYRLSAEAMAAGAVRVEELGEEGSVPTLLVTNDGDERVLFLEGEELRGAKQNRVLNTSVLVAPHARTPIPVSCIERGRWRYRGRDFAGSDTHSSSKLRSLLRSQCTASLKEGRGHRSDQASIWREVMRQMQALGAESPTESMSDTYESKRARLMEFRGNLDYRAGASGLAVAIGRRVVSVDVFDKPTTCERVWGRLLSGLTMDALEAPPDSEPASPEAVLELVERVRQAPWEPAPGVGEGEEFRSDALPPAHAVSLVVGDVVVHGSVVVAD